MTDRIAFGEALLEVIAPNLPDQSVRITELPFLIGRGADNGNHLQLFGKHVSRSAAAIVYENGYYLEDRGQRGGVFLNGTKIARHALRDGDVITFGRDEVHRVRFRAVSSVAAVESLLTQIDDIAHREPSRWDLGQINLLLEATMLLQSELPLDAVLGTMLNHSIAVTEAERGLLLEPAADGSLRVRTARCSDGLLIQPEAFSPSQTALRAAMERKSRIIAEDIREADPSMRGAESIVAQQLRAVIVIPLYATQNRSPEQSAAASEGKFLGVLYLDSRRPTAFSREDESANSRRYCGRSRKHFAKCATTATRATAKASRTGSQHRARHSAGPLAEWPPRFPALGRDGDELALSWRRGRLF